MNIKQERELFEEYQEIPEGVCWLDERGCYATKDSLLIPDMDYINDLFDCWQARAKVPSWISVDTPPELGVLVLGLVKVAFSRPMEIIETEVTLMLDNDGWRIGNDLIAWDYDFNYGDMEITHWQPLPPMNGE